MDKMSVTIDSTDMYRKIQKLLNKVDRPEPLLTVVGKYIREQTRKMFVGKRPDTTSVRGEKWPKLSEKTVQSKLTKKAKGLIIGNPRRPLIATGALKRSLLAQSAIKIDKTGLEYGTEQRSKKGFSYPALHEVGGRKTPQRRWLFLNRSELLQISTTVRDWLSGKLIKKII